MLSDYFGITVTIKEIILHLKEMPHWQQDCLSFLQQFSITQTSQVHDQGRRQIIKGIVCSLVLGYCSIAFCCVQAQVWLLPGIRVMEEI